MRARARSVPRGLRHALAHETIQEAIVGLLCARADDLGQIVHVDALHRILFHFVLKLVLDATEREVELLHG